MELKRRKIEADRKAMAEAAASARRATDGQMSEDAERLIAAWNERQARGMPMSFSPTLRMLDRHPDAAVTSLIPSLSCRSARLRLAER